MWIWTIKASIISVVFIFLIHNIYGFFKNTLTVPKTKDLVNSPTKQYEHIFQTLNRNASSPPSSSSSSEAYSMLPSDIDIQSATVNPYTTLSEPKPTPSGASMKNELKKYLKKQLNTDSGNADPSYSDVMDISNHSFSSFSSIS